MALCEACSKITLKELQTSERRYPHLPLEDLRVSAKTCELCDLLLLGLCKAHIVELRLPDEPQDYKEQGKPLTPLYPAPTQLQLSMNKMAKGYISEMSAISEEPDVALYFELSGKDQPIMPLLVGHLDLYSASDAASAFGLHPYEEIDTEATFECLRELTKGVAAETDASERVIPHRLLELTGHDGQDGDTPQVRLIETNSLGESAADVQWVALSWRWGTGLTMTTTKESLKERLKGINFSLLPPTFQDAVKVTLKLGLRYLWIDALCIVQDDTDDWRTESAIMGHIYRNSYCTLSAHAAKDWSTGFLESALDRKRPLKLGLTDTDGCVFFVSEPADITMELEHDHLSKRGWILQERLLPHQTIHFCPGQVIWESRNNLGIWNGRELSTYRPQKASRPAIVDAQAGSSPISWFNVIERYTSTALTKESDKLVALEGLAKLTEQSCGVTYLVGLWQDRLHTGLLWAAKQPMREASVHRAPSWSWACLEGAVQYPLTFEHRITELAAPDFEFVGAVAFDGYPALRLDVDLSYTLVSRTPVTGRLPQRPPIVWSKSGGMETLADVAHQHGLGMVDSPEPLHQVGYRLIELVSDPQIDENTPVRIVADEWTNPIGWAVMDEDEHEEFRATLPPGKDVLDKLAFIKVATLSQDAPAEVADIRYEGGINSWLPPRTFVLFLRVFNKIEIEAEPGKAQWLCRRIGMGCIYGRVPFLEVTREKAWLF